MKIIEVKPKANHKLQIVLDDGRSGIFEVKEFLKFEAFTDLKDEAEFNKIKNGGYFVEWECGADLSADTIEAHLICY